MSSSEINGTALPVADGGDAVSAYPLPPSSPLERFAAPLFRGFRAGADSFSREMEAGRGFLWLPVCFGTGILLYFSWPGEPSAIALVVLTVGLVGGAILCRSRIAAYRFLVAMAFLVAGAATMKLHTDKVAAPRIEREMTTVVTGFIAYRQMAVRGGTRIIIDVHEMENVRPELRPARVRVTVRSNHESLKVGDAIEVTARLSPPNGPVIPNGYDFGRFAFYQGIGASGFAYGAARPADLGQIPFHIRAQMPLAGLREIIRERTMAALPGDPGRIAAALVMGDQGGISEETQEAMRTSGLGHVLSISGLHMALIAGSAFALFRGLLALSPSLALKRPIKKWAAFGALLVATFYLGISGMEVATQRAYIMLAIMLAAVLLDRRAITLRNVALSALAVMLITPESLLTASFQMSFAATIALVAAYEKISERADRRTGLSKPFASGIIGAAWRNVTGLFMTSLVAGLATTPFGIYHFQRTAPLSLVANMVAMPAVGAIVMPMVLIAILVMPFGLELMPLMGMELGVAWMILVAQWTTALSGEADIVRMAPPLSLFLAVGGFLWLTLWHEKWRLLGIVPMLLAIPVALLAPRPDILVSTQGSAVAVRGADGRYDIIGERADRFAMENWLRADGDPRKIDAPDLDGNPACDLFGCVLPLASGGIAARVDRPDAFAEDCIAATIVVSRYRAPSWCADTAIVIDRNALRQRGAHALYRIDGIEGEDGFRIETAYPAVPRPWMASFSSAE